MPATAHRPVTFAISCALSGAFVFLYAAPGALAAHPFGTDDAGTVGAAVAEIELAGGAVLDGATRPGGDFGLGLHVGLADRLDAGVGFVFTLPGDEGRPGLADPMVDLKLRLFEPDGGAPGLALRLDYKVPQSVAEYSGHDVGGVLITSWALGAVELHANAGLQVCAWDTGEQASLLQASVGFVAPAAAGLAFGAEVLTEGNPSAGPVTVAGLVAAM